MVGLDVVIATVGGDSVEGGDQAGNAGQDVLLNKAGGEVVFTGHGLVLRSWMDLLQPVADPHQGRLPATLGALTDFGVHAAYQPVVVQTRTLVLSTHTSS